MAQVRASLPAEAGWLAEAVGAGQPSSRRRRLEQLLFAQRVFGEAGPASLPDVLAAVRGLPEARSLLLALERIGTRDPALFAVAVGAARRAGGASGRGEALRVHRGLQGALRVRPSRALRAHARSRGGRAPLAVVVRGPGGRRRARPGPRGRGWEGVLLPELGRAVYGAQPPGDAETTILRAMAGDRVEGREDLAPLEWEGLVIGPIWDVPSSCGCWRSEEAGRRKPVGGPPRVPDRRAEDPRLVRQRARGGARLARLRGGPRSARRSGPRRRGPLAAARFRQRALGAARGGRGPGSSLARPGLAPRPGEGSGEPLAPRARRRCPARRAARARRRPASGPRGAGGARQPAPTCPTPAATRSPRPSSPAGPARRPCARARRTWPRRAARRASTRGEPARSSGCSSTSRTPGGASSPSGSPSTSERPTRGASTRGASPTIWPRASCRGCPAPSRSTRTPGGCHSRRSSRRSWTSSFAWRFTSRRAGCQRASIPPSCRRSCRTSSRRPDPLGSDDRLGLDAWVRAQGRERLDDAVASLVGRGPLQPAPTQVGARCEAGVRRSPRCCASPAAFSPRPPGPRSGSRSRRPAATSAASSRCGRGSSPRACR